MIPKMTSHELNNILNNANSKLDGVIEDVKEIKSNISKRLKILRYEAEYIEYQMEDLKRVHRETTKPNNPGQDYHVFTIPDITLANSYEKYGCTVTPKFKSVPVNVFNIMATATGEAFFRDIAEVAINGVIKPEYRNILKHDSTSDKELFFEEINGDNPSMEITITLDKTKSLGNSFFNAIELDMFLNGAYTVDYIRIYKEDIVETDTNKNKYDEFQAIDNAGKMRLVLNKEYEFNRVDIKITPKFSTQVNGVKISPIGIKHIYFYNAKFVSDSYVIAIIESQDFIDKIDNEFSIVMPNKTITAKAKEEGILFYLSCTKNPSTGETILSSLQEPSTQDSMKAISMNVKKIYAKIPLKFIVDTNKDAELKNQSIVGFTFTAASKIF